MPETPRRLDLLLPPAGSAADRLVSVAFEPWRRGGSRPSSARGLFEGFVLCF
jgi:hypothetical protein